MSAHLHRIHTEARALCDAIESAAADFEGGMRGQWAARPYATMAMAVGVGYAVGGGLSSRLTALMFDAAARIAFAVLARELTVRLGLDRGPPSGCSE